MTVDNSLELDSETLTKSKLVDYLNEQVGLNKRESMEIIVNFFFHISESLIHGEWVKLSGFGNFTLRDKSFRPGRNPKTGVEASIEPRRVVRFHSGQKLRNIIEKSAANENNG